MLELIVYAGHGGELPARVPTLADSSTVNNAATQTSSCTPERGPSARRRPRTTNPSWGSRTPTESRLSPSLPRTFVRKRADKCAKAGKRLSSRPSRRARMFPCGWILLAKPAPLHVSGAPFLFPTRIHPHLHFIWGAVMKRFSISVWCCL